MTEIMTDVTGRGELSLLLPAMARISEAKRQLVCIGAPHVLFSPALEQAQIDPARVTQIDTSTIANIKTVRPKPNVDALWSAEQVLKSGTAGMVLLWTRECSPEALHRLHLSVLGKDTVVFHFRSTTSVTQRSPAWLRLTLTGDAQRIRLQVLKCRGHLMTRPLIEIERALVQPRLFAQLAADRFMDNVTRFGTTRTLAVSRAVKTSGSGSGSGSKVTGALASPVLASVDHVEPDAT